MEGLWRVLFRELANIHYLSVEAYIIYFFDLYGQVKIHGRLAQYVSAVKMVHVTSDFPQDPHAVEIQTTGQDP